MNIDSKTRFTCNTSIENVPFFFYFYICNCVFKETNFILKN